ncbi:MAG: hypothetical protein ACK57G_15700, partial [Planctomycetota bacterium]
MGTASLSLAGCDCRPMGTSPIETKSAPRVFGYRISKRARAWTGFISRDARASGLRGQHHGHVHYGSNRGRTPMRLIGQQAKQLRQLLYITSGLTPARLIGQQAKQLRQLLYIMPGLTPMRQIRTAGSRWLVPDRFDSRHGFAV